VSRSSVRGSRNRVKSGHPASSYRTTYRRLRAPGLGPEADPPACPAFCVSQPRVLTKPTLVCHGGRGSRVRIDAQSCRCNSRRVSSTQKFEDDATPTSEREMIVRRAGRGGIAVAVAKLYFIFVGLVQQIVLPRVLGAAGYGGLSRVFSLTSIAYNSVVSTSIQGTSRAVSRATLDERPQVIRHVLRWHSLVALPLLLVVWFSAPLLCRWLNAAHLVLPLRAMGGVFFFYALYAPIVGVINGQQRFVVQAGLDMTFATLRTIALIVGAWWFVRRQQMGVNGAVWGFVFASGIVTVLAGAMAGIGRSGPAKLNAKKYVAYVLPLFAGQILLNALLQLDITLLGKFAADAADVAGIGVLRADAIVASYRATQLFSFLPYQLLLSITFILFPLLAQAHRDGNRADVALFIRSGLRLALIVAGAMIAVSSGIPGDLLHLVFTSDIAEPAIHSMGLLTLGFGAFAVFGILTTILTSLQHERTSALVTALAVILVVLLSFLLVRGQPFGANLLWRMAIATSCGLVLATCAAGYFVYRFTGALVSRVSLLRVALSLGASILLGRYFVPHRILVLLLGQGAAAHGLVRTVFAAVCLEIVYVACLAWLGELSRADLQRVLSFVQRRPAQK